MRRIHELAAHQSKGAETEDGYRHQLHTTVQITKLRMNSPRGWLKGWRPVGNDLRHLKELGRKLGDAELEDGRARLFEGQDGLEDTGDVVGILEETVVFCIAHQVDGPVDDVQRTLGLVLEAQHRAQHLDFVLQDQAGALDRVQRRVLPFHRRAHVPHEQEPAQDDVARQRPRPVTSLETQPNNNKHAETDARTHRHTHTRTHTNNCLH